MYMYIYIHVYTCIFIILCQSPFYPRTCLLWPSSALALFSAQGQVLSSSSRPLPAADASSCDLQIRNILDLKKFKIRNQIFWICKNLSSENQIFWICKKSRSDIGYQIFWISKYLRSNNQIFWIYTNLRSDNQIFWIFTNLRSNNQIF